MGVGVLIMDKETVEYIKKNLKIEITSQHRGIDYDHPCHHIRTTVSLFLGNELVDTDTTEMWLD